MKERKRKGRERGTNERKREGEKNIMYQHGAFFRVKEFDTQMIFHEA